MAFSRVQLFVVVGLLCCFVGSALGATEVCNYDASSSTAKQTCNKSLSKGDKVTITCPDSATFQPSTAFSAKDALVCKEALADLNATCSSTEKLNVLVPNVDVKELDNKRWKFDVIAPSEIKTSVTAYASCKATGDKGFTIAIAFTKDGTSSASGLAAFPAMLLGALASLIVISSS